MSLRGQTTVEPCAICGEPAERQVELISAVKKGAVVDQVEGLAVMRWLCAEHLAHYREAAKEREEEAERRRERKRAMKAAQEEAVLFDPDPRGAQ